MLILLLSLTVGNCVSFQSLYERQLKSSYGFQILKHYHSEPFGQNDVKKFKGESMLFMTPWREEGIQLSLKYLRKFDYFVPCYYDLRKTHNQTVEMDTSEHYSEQYLKRARQANPEIQIIPRVYIHGMQGDVLFLASTKDEQWNRTVGYFREVLENPLYQGLLFVSPFLTPNHQYPFSMRNFLKEIRKIADQLGKKLMISMDGVSPKSDQKINKKKTRELINLADKVVITNYDCPRGNDGMTIPISPMDWIKENYEFYCEVYSKAKLTPKLIMAIPLYGYFVAMYGKYDPIEGKEMLEKLRKEKQAWLSWNDQIEECMIYLNKMEYLYFPCLHFLNSRLRYFESINVGVAAFEIGSGLELFMQMF